MIALKIDQEKLNELCSKVDLMEYAEKSIDFERRGSDVYAAHCPRHEDKTPSLMITPSKNLFYCHSCHVGGNIINWLMTFEHLSFNDAVDKTAMLAGIEIDHLKTCESLSYFKQIKRSQVQPIKFATDRQILPWSYYEQFSNEIPQEWVDEGIPADVLREYEIRVDKKSNRIVYPVYDKDGNFIGVKGRTRFKNYKDLQIKKYLNYQKIQTTDYFMGMKQNRDMILADKSAIVFEGLKSVMHVAAWGYNNCLSSETSDINDAQAAILISMGIRDLTIAFDRDVEMGHIRKTTKLLQKYMNVYAVYDKWGLLQDKDSPCDRGEDVWRILYERRIRL